MTSDEVKELKDKMEQMKHEEELKKLQTEHKEAIRTLEKEKSDYKQMAVAFLIGFGCVAFAAVFWMLRCGT